MKSKHLGSLYISICSNLVDQTVQIQWHCWPYTVRTSLYMYTHVYYQTQSTVFWNGCKL